MRQVPAHPEQSHSPILPEPALDIAVIRIDRVHALASLVSLGEVAEQFTSLELPGQVAIFGLFEDAVAEARAALTG